MHDKGGFSMGILESIGKRRTYYQINKELPVAVEKIRKVVEQATELTPDAFNMKSARVVLALGAKQDALWDAVYDAFGGKVAREKIDGFKAGAGTVLYFYDEEVIKSLQSQFPMYAENFPTWAQRANGMLQFAIWTALRDLDVGANIQHYNPVIDKAVQDLFDLPASWKLIAQMPFGGIVAEPEPKEQEDIAIRVQVQV
jgi:predicted oxidoreductase (fatty acid repression mutant protein)